MTNYIFSSIKKEAVQKVFKSMIAPHTLTNFESLSKFIELIINYFYLYCRSKFLFALTKQNFSDSLYNKKPPTRKKWGGLVVYFFKDW